MQQLLEASANYVAGLSSTQHEILHLWTKCPSLFRNAIQGYDVMQRGNVLISSKKKELIESRFEIVRQLDSIFEGAPTLDSINAPHIENAYTLYRTLNKDADKVVAQIPHYTSTTVHSDPDALDDVFGLVESRIELQLRLERNVPILYISSVSCYEQEEEVLLPRNVRLNNVPSSWANATCQVTLTREVVSHPAKTFPAEPELPLSSYLSCRWWDMTRAARVTRRWCIYKWGWGAEHKNSEHWRDVCLQRLECTEFHGLRDIYRQQLTRINHPFEVLRCQLNERFCD
jgi:hypothetical protein